MDSYSSSFSSSPSSSDSLEADDLEAGSCSGYTPYPLPPPPLYAWDWRRKGSSNGGPMARFFFEDENDEPRHFLDSCFLCKRTLAGNRDIFMYRGDTPFCSEECRQEQIEMDEAREKMMKLSLKKSSAKEQKNGSKNSPQKPQKIHLRSGTVVAG